jgi:phage gpG-like protein
MSATVQITISNEAAGLISRIADKRGLQSAIAREMDFQLNLTVGHIVKNRLRGHGPFPVEQHRLGERSHNLYRSLRASKCVIQGDTITGTIGTNVKYAAIHEFGGVIKRVTLAGSVRLATERRGNLIRQGPNGKLAVFARQGRKTATTVPFAGGKRYEITIPARAPITTGIQDRAADIGAGVSRAIIAFWQGGPK